MLKFDKLPEPIKDEVLTKILERQSCVEISALLRQSHGIPISKNSIYRAAKLNLAKFGGLLSMGMPVEVIVKTRAQIEAAGIEATEQALLEKLAEKNGTPFDYLDCLEGEV
ncbi:hypothetical protein A1507_18815 [Methylomonas koyamae]|uniref:Uncharacterized protein n=1 Tax=Methylomonas koyamae TaxID=702114 RepID=A0A177N3Q9_9GAMM|nr:hypothetical protein [Methylomonas koyamae]OAI12637.1 hypothetical protein A1507_18815 [Methylomonas koyamae]